jgi:hypothetical protein
MQSGSSPYTTTKEVNKLDLKSLIKITVLKRFEWKQWEHELYGNHVEMLLNHPTTEATNLLGGGVYRMHNKDGEIIYVGKSNNIHRRLLEHIGHRSNTSYFVDEAVKFDYTINNDPAWQTMLEGIFIAYHEPKYNDEIKDRRKLENEPIPKEDN